MQGSLAKADGVCGRAIFISSHINPGIILVLESLSQDYTVRDIISRFHTNLVEVRGILQLFFML